MTKEQGLTPEEIAHREELVKKHLSELLPVDGELGRMAEGGRNFIEVLVKIVDFYEDQKNNRSGRSNLRTKEEAQAAQDLIHGLLTKIQTELGDNKLTDGKGAPYGENNQIDYSFSRVTDEQIRVITKVIVDSGLPLFIKTLRERVAATVERIRDDS